MSAMTSSAYRFNNCAGVQEAKTGKFQKSNSKSHQFTDNATFWKKHFALIDTFDKSKQARKSLRV